jgi:glucose/arabinose dehydrogenase
MKIFIPFFLIILFSCQSSPSKNDSDAFSQYQKTEPNWMDAEDYVRYVNFFSRTPSNEMSKYRITGDCGGYPRVDVKTAPGFCLGLVLDGGGTKKPRTAAVISESEVVLVDQGSWNPYDGRIFTLRFANGKSEVKEILNAKSFASTDIRREIINRPHQVTLGPDGKYYVGAFSAILRFDPRAANPLETIELMIRDIPAQGLHPLKAFAFDKKGSIFVNVGSATNVCQKSGITGTKSKSCAEAENFQVGQAQIRKYQFTGDGKISPKFEVFAKGLRNSIALAWDEKRNILMQGENSRDAINKLDAKISNKDFPHDEINIVEKSKHYGWPYCYDKNLNSPEWKYINCSGYAPPAKLLPPHSAPLAFHFYQGSLFPSWYQGRMLISLHGYEAKGHRIVAYKRDAKGLPVGEAQSIVYGWDTKGEQKFGSPVGLTELPDGSVLIIEDTNRKVLRLTYDANAGDGLPVEEINSESSDTDPQDPKEEELRRVALEKRINVANPPPFALFQKKVIDKTCYVCHGGENAPGVQLLRYDDIGNAKRIVSSEKVQEILEMMRGNPDYPPMPPQGFDSPEEQQEAERLLSAWVKTLGN